MNIDWGQIVTHIIGFMIAVWLLKRYAWEGLQGFVDKRRQTIADSFADIDKGKAEVAAQKDHYDREIQQIEDLRREKIQKAAQDADDVANQIKEEARREAVAAREKAQLDISLELDKANETLKNRMVDAVLLTTEKIVHERLDRDKHNKLIEEFLAKVTIGEGGKKTEEGK